MKSKRRLLRVVAVIAIALAAGHIAQYDRGQATTRNASMLPVSASEPDTPPNALAPAAAATATPLQGISATPDPALAPPVLIEASLPAQPASLPPPAVPPVAVLSQPEPSSPVAAAAARDCTLLLALSPRPGAMIDLLLSAPCRPGERVVLRHAGLAVAYRTNEVGALFASLPALATDARVSVLFAGGDTVEATIPLPEAAEFRRFGVQWLGPQGFEVNAFENGADFGQPGHVSPADPHAPAQTMLPLAGFLSVLGDPDVASPMLAQIYTFPGVPDPVPVLIEAAITSATCGREMLGDVVTADRGTVRMSDLSITMPGCDAIGDYLVLKNLGPDMKLASN